jgi:uncharacterized lipoprotein YddW (UPF0748 family)
VVEVSRHRVFAAVVSVLVVLAVVGTAIALTRGGDPEELPTEAGPTTSAPDDPATTSEATPTDPMETPEAEPTTVPEPASGATPQLRGIWVHLLDPTLKSVAGIHEFLDAAAAANLNTVVVQGARRHDAFHESGVLPRTTDEEMPGGLDVLGELVPAAHERGLQVHVWYSIAPTYHRVMTDEDLGSDHITTRHGFGAAESWLQAGNDPFYAYMDPAVPGFQDHVAAMYRDVVERYDVDGVHLDYIRYECVQVADDGSCLSNADPRPATGNQNPITMERFRAHGDGDLDAFLRTQTEDLVRRIYLEVADVDPSVVVSAATIAQSDGPGADREAFRSSRAYWNKAQDWAGWADRGIIDHVYPMAYFRESDPRWAAAYDQWVDFASVLDSDEHVVAIGQGSYLNCVDQNLAQLEEGAAATDGVLVYSYQGDVSEDCPDAQRGDLLRALAQGMFAEPAPVPEVPRKADPTRGHVLVEAGDGQTVTVTGPGGAEQSRRADATGHAGFVWLDPGTWQVTVDGGATQQVEVSAGEVTRVGAG